MTLDEVANHAAHMVAALRKDGFTTCDPSLAAEDAYCQHVFDRSRRGKKFLAGCTPGYYNNEGKLSQERTLDAFWGPPLKYFGMLETIRDEDILQGYDLN